MRGLSTGSLGTQGSGTNGPWPNVAVYLDEQSTQVPGRNLDVYAADFERIEVLTGPQGTLFGAGAQAGVLRYITNKPQLNELSANVKAGYAKTSDGDDSYNVEGVVNIPLIDDTLAMRVVAYQDHRGGYIDNVYSTFTRQGTDLGFAVLHGRRRAGRFRGDQQLATLPTKTSTRSITAAPAPASSGRSPTTGMRCWRSPTSESTARACFTSTQNGVRFRLRCRSMNNVLAQDCPESTQRLKPLEVTIFNEGYTEDEFINTALTVNGKVGMLDLVYAGAYLTRDAETVSDYTNYARGLYGTYYQCTGYSGSLGRQVLHAVERLE